MKKFTYKEEILFQAVCKAAKSFQKIEFKAISDIKTNAVYAEIFHPEFHSVKQMVNYSRIAKIELNKVVMPLPALVPQTIVIAAVSVRDLRVGNDPGCRGRALPGLDDPLPGRDGGRAGPQPEESQASRPASRHRQGA